MTGKHRLFEKLVGATINGNGAVVMRAERVGRHERVAPEPGLEWRPWPFMT